MKTINSIAAATKPYEDQIFVNHNGFTVEVCLRPESLVAAFRLRYQAYIKSEMIPANDDQLLFDDYDFLPNNRVHLVWYEGTPVATVRSCIYSEIYNWSNTEAIEYFGVDIEGRLGKDIRILESNRFAVHPDFQGRQSMMAMFLLFRTHGLNAEFHQCDYIMTSVRSKHVAFYKRFLGLEPLSMTPSFVTWINDEVILLVNQTAQCLTSILKRGMPAYGQEDINLYASIANLNSIENQRNAA